MSEPTEITVTVRIYKHGTRNSYNKGCRCAECRKASAEHHKAQLEANRKRTDQAPHGTRGGYCNWGCRCDACSRAHREYMKVYMAKRSTS